MSDLPSVTDVPAYGRTWDHEEQRLQWERAVGAAVNIGFSSDYAAALGKVDLTGYNAAPTLYDPASAAWDDDGWWRVEYVDGQGANLHIGARGDLNSDLILRRYANDTQRLAQVDLYSQGDGSEFADVFASSSAFLDGSSRGAQIGIATDLSSTGAGIVATDTLIQFFAKAYAGQTDPLLDLQDSDGTSRATIAFDQRGPGQNSVSLDLHTSSRLDLYAGDDGSQVTANGPLTGFVDFYAFGADGGGASLRIAAETAQTDPLLDLQDSGGNSVLEVTGDNKIGFYNKAPAALQTGVAVSAPGIHAALVNLGLITA